ncbi:MAG TPA: sulfurtransferase/chromate resistance protein [Rhizomicrobium sp.]|jgi:rhodanese-related sulfurtransferase|nr:sulfurtransferase/chromate resistance protein [Rhizomicrobium sp.]
MSAINTISSDKLLRLIGTHKCPAIIDVRPDEEFVTDNVLLPVAVRRRAEAVADWAGQFPDQNIVVVCGRGSALSPGVAAWLRHAGLTADTLEGGVAEWKAAKLAMVPQAKLPKRDVEGRTIWVTRARPKVDRIACPWLIRRFLDPYAVFLYVAPSEVLTVATKFGAAPFDIEGDDVFWSHRNERCTFDVMVEAFGLSSFQALQRLSVIVRGADTGHPELVPEAAGLLAASLGLSRMYDDDLEQLEAGMFLYDSFYRWCRDATDETHNWASHKPKGQR